MLNASVIELRPLGLKLKSIYANALYSLLILTSAMIISPAKLCSGNMWFLFNSDNKEVMSFLFLFS